MKTESRLFTGVAAFFAVSAAGYGWFAAEPAGTAVLAVAFLMAALVAFFCRVQYRRHGLRAQDHRDAEVRDTAGPLDFFSPHSPWPVIVALGAVLVALGIVYGLWLVLLGFGVLAPGVAGLVFQYARREGQRAGESSDGSGSGAGSGMSTRSS
ncbi:aa3-type cytochrome oxidase subunit IV [Streptomyces sp. JW3]|uniref:aa3-type cytochrome oxidase subunit IV n=1 Tax=Streptomyces sp. JW3 TaxID=3456955 RepID=UPI003FA488F1